ncbi:DUF4097 domain-containing protein [Streptomyces sp. NPDC060194]|uniref:DUF4097 family beta strand repeat-containing protein n=1 Tax=Streptomyces sp. NPDC060194 TaxID=3347069 RepID=UPI003669D51D
MPSSATPEPQSFTTPGPITAQLEVGYGTVLVRAAERTETTVRVRPGNEADDRDVQSAAQTQVDLTGGRLTVRGPRGRNPFHKIGAVVVEVELPTGSEVQATTGLGDVHCEGTLGDVRLKSALGNVAVERAATAALRTATGTVRAQHLDGNVEVHGAGRVEIGYVGGNLAVTNVNGETEVGEVLGETKVKSSNGSFAMGTAHAGVDVRSALGGIRIARLTRGVIDLRTSTGEIELGVPETTAAWLDVHTRAGLVRNQLPAAGSPSDKPDRAEVHAHTSVGNITVTRAA